MKSATVSLCSVLVLVSCTPRPAEKPREWKRELPQSAALSGQKVEESRDGAWVVRRTAPPAGAADARPGAMAPMLAAAPGGGSDRAARAVGFAHDSDGFGDPGSAGGGALPLAPAEGGPGGPAPAAAATAAPPTPSAPPPPAEPAVGSASDALGTLSESLDGAPAADAGAPLGLEAPGSEPAAESGAPAPAFAPMRAGVTDDNADLAKFLEFLATWSDRKDVAGGVDYLDVGGRTHILVVNRQGKPVPGARVLIVDEGADRIVWAARTYGDGRAPYYPNVKQVEPPSGAVEISMPPKPSLIVEVTSQGRRTMARWDGAGDELRVEIDAASPVAEPIALDVLFLIDTTGSMSDEIDRVKATLLEVTRRLRSIEREFDLRYAAVLYRDIGDEYVTKAHPFTPDIGAFDGALKSVSADGGGDGPESLNQGLAEAVGRADWREGAARVMFLIADAPPHMDYQGDVRYGESLKVALDKGIRIHSVAASGVDAPASFIFRQIAQFTRGKFIFIEYGSAAASAAAHGVAGETKSNNLDEIIFEQIRAEVAGWGR